MKLILLRHAKSSWDDPILDDHDRPLNERGRGSATAIGQWLNRKGHHPDQVACSTALRARETCDLVSSAWAAPFEVTHVDGLYHAGPDRILREIRKYNAETLLIVGHNPGFAEVAEMLAHAPPDHADFHRFPTASTLVLTFELSKWADLKCQSGRVVDFVTPRTLE